ncbi:DUF5388 domain-containing protein [Vagococcus lutrae]|uniref:DUF5388 domain-containing protein n=1 Tax=Vagococcus lutrae TaxID=81947 RepID=UPI00288E863E|nr:DUF5388 domain-containing protein [Vagococcus lutrae]MDT2844645.1 DUF5388 domain-containing protein [Vagococcus lutrae]
MTSKGKLLDHNKKKKSTLTRGSKVEVAKKVSIDEINSKRVDVHMPDAVKSVTEPVNIRVDNHIRNEISAFVTLGKFDSYKEFCEHAVEVYKESLTQDELKRHSYLKETYELKDYERAQKKKK